MITFMDLSESQLQTAADALASALKGPCVWRSCADKARDIREACEEQGMKPGELTWTAIENELGIGL